MRCFLRVRGNRNHEHRSRVRERRRNDRDTTSDNSGRYIHETTESVRRCVHERRREERYYRNRTLKSNSLNFPHIRHDQILNGKRYHIKTFVTEEIDLSDSVSEKVRIRMDRTGKLSDTFAFSRPTILFFYPPYSGRQR